VKGGVGGSAADHRAGVSVDTISRASSCWATERMSRTLKPIFGAPTAAGRALGRSGAVHRVKIVTQRPSLPRGGPPWCRTPWGRSPRPDARRSRRFPDTYAPPCLSRRCAALLSHAGAGCGGYPRGRLHESPQNATLHFVFKTRFF